VSEPEGASAETPPVAPVDDIEKRLEQVKQELSQQFEERAKGFQRALNEKETALQKAQREAEELRMAGLSEDEKAEAEWQKLQSENARLQTEVQLLQLQSEYPEEMPEFRKILEASSPKEQLELIRALRRAQQAAPPPPANPAEGEPEVPPVDLNNPATHPTFGNDETVRYNGQPVTEEWADRVLKQFGLGRR
jgi:DNA repair exonuclease SbcCD ATPase subunit